MNQIQQCITITEDIIQLANTVDHDDRENSINKIEILIEQRATLLAQFQEPYSSEEKILGTSLISLDQEMTAALQRFLSSIQKDIGMLEKKKKSVTHYSNPYATANSLDGMFYDKRQ